MRHALGLVPEGGPAVSDRCGAVAEYCGERLVCDCSNCRNYHGAHSMRYGWVLWNDENRPQPSNMFHGLVPSTRHGSAAADANVYAAAMMQDAVNRLEHLVQVQGLKP